MGVDNAAAAEVPAMHRRQRSPHGTLALLAAVAGLLMIASPVAAKEGMQAELTTTIPRDATPGTTLQVEWDAFMPSETGERNAIFGSPISIRFVPDGDAKPTEAAGRERPSGSGHYVATIEVPAGGIAEVEIGWFGEACVNGTCTKDDLQFLLVGRVLVDGTDPAAARVVAAAASAATAAVPAPTAAAATPVTPVAQAPAATSAFEPGWLAAGAVAIASVVGLLGAGRLLRRRGETSASLSSDASQT
jgi:hypothetical protein